MSLHITDSEFKNEVLDSKTLVLVDFWAEWCGPCRMISPIIDEISSELNGKIKVVKLNVDENPETSMNYSIRSIPTLMLFKDGKVVEQIIGAQPKKSLLDKISIHILFFVC